MNPLPALSMAKYERLLPRLFPDAVRFELRDNGNDLLWSLDRGEPEIGADASDEPALWTEFATGIDRRRLENGSTQFRAPLFSIDKDQTGTLAVTYRTDDSVPLSTAPDTLRRAFTEALAFIQDESDLQEECNQLARELTERYEELNLVYSTKDQVEYFEEGQEALVRLVKNCADYLDVGLAALVCRDRGIELHDLNKSDAPVNADEVLDLLRTAVYDNVESQVQSLVLNESDTGERQRVFGGRSDNLLAHPIIDDHGTAIGMLAVVARRDLHTFSNGDRNLLEVMAKKASRIIHTHHDSLTGLMNRSGFESSLVSALASTKNSNALHCLLHVDVDQLHLVNDLMGHQEGDHLIRRIAKLLRNIVRDSDSLARLGGDEFGVLLSNCDINQGHSVAQKIRRAIRKLTVVSASRQLDVSASIGIALVAKDTEGIVSVMASAEIACKSAKDGGRNRIEVFEKDNTELVRRSEDIEWISRVQDALRSDRFELHCQPVMPVDATANTAHFEILVRMLDENREPLSPGLFLPAAERYQLMPLLDRWVIRNALKMLSEAWTDIGATGAVFCINLSGQSLTNTGFLPFVADELLRSGVTPEQVCFEITETPAISNID